MASRLRFGVRPFRGLLLFQCLGRLGLVRNINIYTFSDMSIRGGAIPLIRVCAVILVHEKGTEDPDEEAGDTPHTTMPGQSFTFWGQLASFG